MVEAVRDEASKRDRLHSERNDHDWLCRAHWRIQSSLVGTQVTAVHRTTERNARMQRGKVQHNLAAVRLLDLDVLLGRRLRPDLVLVDDGERLAVPHTRPLGEAALVQREADRVELRDRPVKAGLRAGQSVDNASKATTRAPRTLK